MVPMRLPETSALTSSVPTYTTWGAIHQRRQRRGGGVISPTENTGASRAHAPDSLQWSRARLPCLRSLPHYHRSCFTTTSMKN